MITLIPENDANRGRGAFIVYILYLAGFLTGGITNLIGLIIAYVNREEQPDWLQTHYRYQIRTFWIGCFYCLFALPFLITFILGIIGHAILLFVAVWLIIRCAKGIKWVDAKKPVPNPASWGF